eukprot:c12136_g1_i1.p1 GENE.c12136_g1_i1~~c12136_g1_i1.p1  ORF type:complete len:620 (-),score=146.31 c12136_g1_i1:930-2756(-)
MSDTQASFGDKNTISCLLSLVLHTPASVQVTWQYLQHVTETVVDIVPGAQSAEVTDFSISTNPVDNTGSNSNTHNNKDVHIVKIDVVMSSLNNLDAHSKKVQRWWGKGGEGMLLQELGATFAAWDWEDPQSIPLRLMSANLRVDWEEAGRQGKTNPPSDGVNAWSSRFELMLNVLRAHKPTVIGTQEGLNAQLAATALALGYERIGRSRRGNLNDEFSDILFDPEKLDILAGDTEWLSDTPSQPGSVSWNSSLPRIVTWALFRVRQSRAHFVFVNTHLDHRSEDARVHSAHHIINLTHRLAQQYGVMPVFLTGDFNANKKHEVTWSTLITEGGFSDAWHAARTKRAADSCGGTFHGFYGPNGSHLSPDLSSDSMGYIDWLLLLAPPLPNTLTLAHTNTSFEIQLVAAARKRKARNEKKKASEMAREEAETRSKKVLKVTDDDADLAVLKKKEKEQPQRQGQEEQKGKDGKEGMGTTPATTATVDLETESKTVPASPSSTATTTEEPNVAETNSTTSTPMPPTCKSATGDLASPATAPPPTLITPTTQTQTHTYTRNFQTITESYYFKNRSILEFSILESQEEFLIGVIDWSGGGVCLRVGVEVGCVVG